MERERGTHFGTSFAPALHGETSQIKVDRLGSMRVGFNTVDVFSDSLILSTWDFFCSYLLTFAVFAPFGQAACSSVKLLHTAYLGRRHKG